MIKDQDDERNSLNSSNDLKIDRGLELMLLKGRKDQPIINQKSFQYEKKISIANRIFYLNLELISEKIMQRNKKEESNARSNTNNRNTRFYYVFLRRISNWLARQRAFLQKRHYKLPSSRDAR